MVKDVSKLPSKNRTFYRHKLTVFSLTCLHFIEFSKKTKTTLTYTERQRPLINNPLCCKQRLYNTKLGQLHIFLSLCSILQGNIWETLIIFSGSCQSCWSCIITHWFLWLVFRFEQLTYNFLITDYLKRDNSDKPEKPPC